MINIKKYSLLLGATLLLAACTDTTDPNVGSEESSSEAVVESIEESTNGAVESESVAESTDESTDTELNHDEAAKIEAAKTAISDLTGLEEGDDFLYLIDGVEGEIVTINIRENGDAAASSRGFFRYDNETGNVQELDIITNEYVDYPAN